jgi:hypothetical protein
MQTVAEHVLAVDLRLQRFGFVLFERPNVLLDWGVSGYHSSVSAALSRKIAHAVEQFAPSLILCRQTVTEGHLLDVLKQEAFARSIPLHSISTNDLHEYFAQRGRHNKHQVSELVAIHFPELAWRRPRERKPWQSEPTVQALFDAAALILMHSIAQPIDWHGKDHP